MGGLRLLVAQLESKPPEPHSDFVFRASELQSDVPQRESFIVHFSDVFAVCDGNSVLDFWEKRCEIKLVD